MFMLKKITLIILMILCINFVYSANVEVSAYVYKDITIFNYVLKFNENDTLSKFSIEKPRDGHLSYIVDEKGPVEYDEAGDYYIFKPENIDNNTFLLKYDSKILSQDIVNINSFKTYITFNFPVDNLIFNLYLKDEFGEVIDTFPRDYVYDNEKYTWNLSNVSKESLFVVNFKGSQEILPIQPETNFDKYYLILSIIIPLVVFTVLIFYITHNNKKSKNKQEFFEDDTPEEDDFDNEESVKTHKKEVSTIANKEVEKDIEKETKDNFNEIINKHLTENEKEVVKVIREHEGITQYDILNYLPKLTKSNLSKIISKLNARKILVRIRVGKVNKIHLGDKLKHNGTSKEEKTQE